MIYSDVLFKCWSVCYSDIVWWLPLPDDIISMEAVFWWRRRLLMIYLLLLFWWYIVFCDMKKENSDAIFIDEIALLKKGTPDMRIVRQAATVAWRQHGDWRRGVAKTRRCWRNGERVTVSQTWRGERTNGWLFRCHMVGCRCLRGCYRRHLPRSKWALGITRYLMAAYHHAIDAPSSLTAAYLERITYKRGAL